AQKIATPPSKPQPTRHVIRGVLHRPDAQLVLVDTPGLHRPRTLLGQRLNDLVHETWSEVDVSGVCFPADEPVGRGDRFIASEVGQLKAKIIAVVTKVDLVSPAVLAERLLGGALSGERGVGASGRGAARRDGQAHAGVAAALPGRRADRRAGAGADRGA